MNFHQAFFDELDKLAAMRHYPDPSDTHEDRRHWDSRRNWATAAGSLGAIPSAIAARKGRKLRSLAGSVIGMSAGGTVGAIGGPVGAGIGAAAGGAIGARLAHGEYDKRTSVHEMRKYKDKKK